MRIAYTMAPGRGDTDLLLSGLAESLAASGLRVCGTVQINTEREDCHPCDMDVKILPNGPVIRISQTLGKDSRGCRLDPQALEEAVANVEREFVDPADLLVVNKFGKHEAEGRGFRDLIAEALNRNIPVIVGLNALNHAAFLEFSGGLAEQLPPDRQAILAWIEASFRRESEVA